MATVIAFEALEECDLDEWLERQKALVGDGRPIRCAHCAHPVSTSDQRIARAGAHTHRFENPAGITFEIACFRHAPGCRPVGEATLDYTWFPGHPWAIALCASCATHLGWSYGPGATGDAFHGLIMDRLSEDR